MERGDDYYRQLDEESTQYKAWAKFNKIRSEEPNSSTNSALNNIKDELEALLEWSNRIGSDEIYVIKGIIEDIVLEIRK